MQVLRADLVIQDPDCKMNMQEPRRSLLKPEVVWQLEKGFQQSSEQVGQPAVKLRHAVACRPLLVWMFGVFGSLLLGLGANASHM